MNNIIIDKKLALEYIRDTLRSSKKKLEFVKHAKYHHNTRYHNAASVCRNGILTMLDLHKYKIVSFSPEILKKFEDDDFHVNGINAVSLSIYGMDDFCVFVRIKVSGISALSNSALYVRFQIHARVLLFVGLDRLQIHD